MPRYFFHVRDGQEYLDTEGTELKDLAAAQTYALQVVTHLIGKQGSEFWDGEDWRLHVEDEASLELFRLQFQAVMKPVPYRWGVGLFVYLSFALASHRPACR